MKTLITGASKGIGLALAYEFARNGHDLVLVARDEDRLHEVSKTLQLKYGVKVDVIAMDLSRVGSGSNLIEEVASRNHQIECLVNNAGFGYLGRYTQMSSETVNNLIQLNITCLSELTRHFARQFVTAGQGKILQVASTAGFQPGPMMAVYYASKAYVISLSQAIAYELKGTAVRLSILCPGPTNTEFMKTAHMEETHLGKGMIGIMSPETVARIAYRGLMKNKLFIIPGIMNKILASFARILPAQLLMPIVARFHKK